MNDYVTIPLKKLNKLYRIAISCDVISLSDLATQAFTSFTCIRCDLDFSYPNGNTPNVCRKCSEVLENVDK